MALLKSFGADVLAANVAKRQALHDSRIGIAEMPVPAAKTPAKRGKKKKAETVKPVEVVEPVEIVESPEPDNTEEPGAPPGPVDTLEVESGSEEDADTK